MYAMGFMPCPHIAQITQQLAWLDLVDAKYQLSIYKLNKAALKHPDYDEHKVNMLRPLLHNLNDSGQRLLSKLMTLRTIRQLGLHILSDGTNLFTFDYLRDVIYHDQDDVCIPLLSKYIPDFLLYEDYPFITNVTMVIEYLSVALNLQEPKHIDYFLENFSGEVPEVTDLAVMSEHMRLTFKLECPEQILRVCEFFLKHSVPLCSTANASYNFFKYLEKFPIKHTLTLIESILRTDNAINDRDEWQTFVEVLLQIHCGIDEKYPLMEYPNGVDLTPHSLFTPHKGLIRKLVWHYLNIYMLRPNLDRRQFLMRSLATEKHPSVVTQEALSNNKQMVGVVLLLSCVEGHEFARLPTEILHFILSYACLPKNHEDWHSHSTAEQLVHFGNWYETRHPDLGNPDTCLEAKHRKPRCALQ